jgi:hypothetical protein
MPYPDTIPFTEYDDLRLLRQTYDLCGTSVVYEIGEFTVRSLAFFCSLVLSAPAFLIKNTATTVSLYSVLLGMIRTLPEDADENVKFEHKLYKWTRRLIRTIVPDIANRSNRAAVTTTVELIRDIDRLRYVITQHSPSETTSEEQVRACVEYINREFVRINTLCRDHAASDKAGIALERFGRYVLLHYHVLSRASDISTLERLHTEYSELYRYLRDKKLFVRERTQLALVSLALTIETSRPLNSDTSD